MLFNPKKNGCLSAKPAAISLPFTGNRFASLSSLGLFWHNGSNQQHSHQRARVYQRVSLHNADQRYPRINKVINIIDSCTCFSSYSTVPSSRYRYDVLKSKPCQIELRRSRCDVRICFRKYEERQIRDNFCFIATIILWRLFPVRKTVPRSRCKIRGNQPRSAQALYFSHFIKFSQ